jgi:DNA polymerase III subunit epsilon
MAVEFATLDFETTGLSGAVDRVIEVAVVRTDSDGNVLGEFSSLVNPNRDVGRTDIHGITAGMLAEAPTFEEMLGGLLEILDGAVLVAHNAAFDRRFLLSELVRCDIVDLDIESLCTLKLMYAGYPRGPRRLADCCEFFGIDVGIAHAALDDARMASKLLHAVLSEVDVPLLPEPCNFRKVTLQSSWALPRESVSNPREQESTYLASLIEMLPPQGDSTLASAVSVAQYLNVLDRVLEDRKIEKSEAEYLIDFATELGLSQDRVAGLHAAYVANLCAVALRDGVVSDLERRDLSQVALLLGVSDWEELLEIKGSRELPIGPTSGLAIGASVCFTGEMSLPRPVLSDRAVNCGLIVKSGISKKLDVLVVADSDSMSGKAKKAREIGIRIVSESVFLGMLEELPNS